MSQIAGKLSREPKARATSMRSKAFFTCSRGAYAIFLPSEAENTNFAIGRWEGKLHFRPARQKIIFLLYVKKRNIYVDKGKQKKKKKITLSCIVYTCVFI